MFINSLSLVIFLLSNLKQAFTTPISTSNGNSSVSTAGTPNPWPPWGPTFDELVQQGLDIVKEQYPGAEIFEAEATPVRSSGSYTNPKRFVVVKASCWVRDTKRIVRINNQLNHPEEWDAPQLGEFALTVSTVIWFRKGSTLDDAFGVLKDRQQLNPVNEVILQRSVAPEGARKDQAYWIFKFREEKHKELWVGALDRSLYPAPSHPTLAGSTSSSLSNNVDGNQTTIQLTQLPGTAQAVDTSKI